MRMPLPMLALIALIASLGTAPAAHAALSARGTLAVPVDRSGAVPGTVALSYLRQSVRPLPSDEAVVPLAGGPGQAAMPFAADFAKSLAPLLADRDLLVHDQRGTGLSGALGCFGPSGPGSTGQVRSCAASLGRSRDFYRSVDGAEDIEALRVAGGYRRLVLYGVSYGTRVVLAYAARHPDRVSALVLDSLVPLEGPDVWARPSFQALPRVLRELCAGGACRQATTSPNGDLRAFVRRLKRRPLRGSVTAPDGDPVGVRLTELGLWQVLLAGDLNPALRAELPGAVRAALRGDPTPILRLRARAAGLNGTVPPGLQQGADTVNTTLFTATRCSETAFPWSPAASSDARLRQAAAALRGLPASAFVPFGRAVPFEQGVLDLCSAWPQAPLPAAALGKLPSVPTLILGGAADLRTPLEQARRVAGTIAGARLVSVPRTGHSVLGSDLSGCVDDEIAAFAAGTAASCRPADPQIKPTPRPPLRLASLPGGTKALRTIAAVRATLADVRRQLIGDAIAAGRSVSTGSRTGGLRGGTARVEGDFVRLQSVSYVPGVRVSGSYGTRTGQSSELLITGREAARGRLQIDGNGTARGVLGGRSVESAAATAATRSERERGLELPRFANPRLRASG